MTEVLSPVTGVARPIDKVSDPVFAAEMLGSGVAVEPRLERQQVVSPIAGKLLKVHPHAFVVHDGSIGVLVHLGIDTVKLKGEGFTVLAEEKSEVAAGQVVVEWEPQVARDHEMDTVVLVCQMDTVPGSITSSLLGDEVNSGAPLFLSA